MRKITDRYFEEYLIPLMRKYKEVVFEELEQNLCLEHYNAIHKTNFTENDIELNPAECWFCKHTKDRH